MGLEFSRVRFGTRGAGQVYSFWGQVLGTAPGHSVIGPDAGGMSRGMIRGPHIALMPSDDSSVAEETNRLLECGARLAGKFHNGWGCGWVEMEDPDGNLFVIESREPDDFEALLAGPRKTADPFWADAVDQWTDEQRIR